MHFIGVGVGTISGGIIGGYLMSLHSKKKTESNGHIPRPEFKLFSLLYITWFAPVGLAGYFFVTYFGIHWIFADVFIVIFCFGISAAVVSLQSYIVDSYSLLAGSALTSTIVVRSIFGFGATVVSLQVRERWDTLLIYPPLGSRRLIAPRRPVLVWCRSDFIMCLDLCAYCLYRLLLRCKAESQEQVRYS